MVDKMRRTPLLIILVCPNRSSIARSIYAFDSMWIDEFRSMDIFDGVADYRYDFNFLDDLKTYIHRTFVIVKIVFSYLDSATPYHLDSQQTSLMPIESPVTHNSGSIV